MMSSFEKKKTEDTEVELGNLERNFRRLSSQVSISGTINLLRIPDQTIVVFFRTPLETYLFCSHSCTQKHKQIICVGFETTISDCSMRLTEISTRVSKTLRRQNKRQIFVSARVKSRAVPQFLCVSLHMKATHVRNHSRQKLNPFSLSSLTSRDIHKKTLMKFYR